MRLTSPASPGMVVLYYDGDCGMCQRFRNLVLRLDTRHRVATMSLQSAHEQGRLAALTEERFWSQFHLELPGGTVVSGADALEPLLERLPPARPAAWSLRHVPGARPLARWLYERALERHGGPARPRSTTGST